MNLTISSDRQTTTPTKPMSFVPGHHSITWRRSSGTTLEALHRLIYDIKNRVPEDLSVEHPAAESAVSIRDEYLLPTAHYAFRSAIVGYLALKNMLALANDNGLSDRLSSYSREEFTNWLDRIDQGGSVTG